MSWFIQGLRRHWIDWGQMILHDLVHFFHNKWQKRQIYFHASENKLSMQKLWKEKGWLCKVQFMQTYDMYSTTQPMIPIWKIWNWYGNYYANNADQQCGLVMPYGDKRYGLTVAQAMAYCQTSQSHYLSQCWLIISEVLWHSPEGNFRGNAHDICPWYKFQNY